MKWLWKDVRYGIRIMGRNRGMTTLAVLAFGLGIGLTTIGFSIVHGALLRGLPIRDAGEIMHLERNRPAEGIESMEVTLHDFLEWREEQRAFEDLAAFYSGTVNLRGEERAERFSGAFVTANSFRVLGVQPILGRDFLEEEDDPGAEPVVILGHHVWRDRFDADPGVVGRTVQMNGEQATVVGVMPEGFRFPLLQDLWTPYRMDPVATERGEGITLEVFGRLRDGVDLDRAVFEMNTIASRIAAEHPETNEGVGAVVKPYTEEFIGEEPVALLWTMFAAVFLVFLIACSNVANLLLARAAARGKEVAVRTALGASRMRVTVQLLTESLVLSLAGALVGLGVAFVGIRWFSNAVAASDPPYWLRFEVDLAAFLVAAGLALLAGLFAGLLPALQVTGDAMNDALKDESRGASGLRVGRLSRGLIVAEVTLSVALLVAAGLMIRSVTNATRIDFPFPTEEIFTARMGLFEAAHPEPADRLRFFEAVEERVGALPGVESVTLTQALPVVSSWGTQVELEGRTYPREQDRPSVRWMMVTPSFFDVFEVEAVRGRLLEASDREGAPEVAVVTESFARTHFPGEDALGRRFRPDSEAEPWNAEEEQGEWKTIVGVVPDLWMDGIENEEPEGYVVPLAQADSRFLSLAVRTRDGIAPLGITQAVRDAVASVDADVPLYFVDTLAGSIHQSLWPFRIFGTLFTLIGVSALFLAAVGLYGVMSFSVRNRTREMGIRMALGAAAQEVRRMVLRQGMMQVGLGVVLGLGLALLLARGLEILLFGVRPWDPVVLVSIVGVIGLTGFVATLVPAVRATRVDPVRALRYE